MFFRFNILWFWDSTYDTDFDIGGDSWHRPSYLWGTSINLIERARACAIGETQRQKSTRC